jgi:glycosyltransferase involved in cell wall biosynthesis
LTFDPVTEQMPGPAIRAWNLALQLSSEHTVTLAGTNGAERTHSSMEVVAANGADVDELVARVDVVFAPTSVVRRYPIVATSSTPLCIDMYDPTHLENLQAVGTAGGDAHIEEVAHQVSVINDDLRQGDFFLCASERQRDFWLGSLASLGRINPLTYASDPMLGNLVAVVPFGIDPKPPVPEPGVLRRLFPQIAPEDPVLIWGGGVYNWFDPVSLLYALEDIRARRPDLRLVFLGMQHPNPHIPEMRVATQLREESDRLGLTGRHVFFNTGWVPYDRRGAYLLDADIGVSTHLAHIETYFSSRTRVLDYLWAGLPSVLTGGDILSDEIAAAGVGVSVPSGDPPAIAKAIDSILHDKPERSEVQAFGTRYSWAQVAEPLVAFCRAPWRAADRGLAERHSAGAGPEAGSRPSRTGRWASRLSRR